ncbi:MAG: YceI family protein [Kofleriaceae bacterium]
MKKLSTSFIVAIAAVGLTLGACKKKEEKAAAPPPAPAPAPAPAPPAPTPAPADPTPAATADFLKVTADHVDAAKGPVDVTFAKWGVTKASFDPANLEGGTAELEIDISSLSSGIPDRDAHLQSADFLDVGKFATATVKVDNVKKTGDATYSADATTNLHGVEKKLAITFDVVSKTDDSVTVKTKVPFSRADFGMTAVTDKVKPEVTLEAQMTLKKM